MPNSKELFFKINQEGTNMLKIDEAKMKKTIQQENATRDKIPLVQFWRQAKFYKDTFILEDEYPEIEKAKLLISNEEIDADKAPRKIHPKLQPEPFVGDLALAKCFVVTLNPRAGIPYAEEYRNWENPLLQKITKQNIIQEPRMYPFYYLNPELENTGGGQWWLKALGIDTSDFQTSIKQTIVPNKYLRRLVATLFCDLELCPYHSNQWDNSKLKQLIINKKLKSSLMAIDFIKEIIQDPEKTIFIRGDKDSGYASQILQHFIPELKHDLPNVHYISGQRVWLQPTSKNGKILFDKILNQ